MKLSGGGIPGEKCPLLLGVGGSGEGSWGAAHTQIRVILLIKQKKNKPVRRRVWIKCPNCHVQVNGSVKKNNEPNSPWNVLTLCKSVKFSPPPPDVSSRRHRSPRAAFGERRHRAVAAGVDPRPFHPLLVGEGGVHPTRFPLDSNSSREGRRKTDHCRSTALVLHFF